MGESLFDGVANVEEVEHLQPSRREVAEGNERTLGNDRAMILNRNAVLQPLRSTLKHPGSL